MAKRYLGTLGLLAMMASPLHAAVDLVKLRQAEKVSIALTGKPLTADLRKKFIDEQITLEDLADQLSKGSDFVEYFAQFWTKLLGMQAPIDVYALKTSKGQNYQGIFARTNWLGLGTPEESKHNVDYLTKYIESHSKGPMEIGIVQCNDAPLIVWANSSNMIPQLTRAAVDGFGADTNAPKPIQAGTKPLWQQILNIAKETTAACEDSVASVKPWWDPVKVTAHSRYVNVESYKVPAKVLERCGPALINCNLRNAQGFDAVMDEVGYDISMEPGYIISHVVAEDKPFSEVVTSTSTIMTGTYAYFLGGQGKDLLANFPGGSLPDSNKAIFTAGNRHDRKHYWVNRSMDNAGILTTPAFQILTNGRRAKANKAYETFLCKKFTVPDGAQADPSDATPDLTKRTYCTYCHKSLEPMAAFFNRWPTTGVNNFIYDNAKGVNDTGRFNGQEGAGASSFGKILAESDTFDDCSIRRAFEFVNGRKLSTVELENKVPPLLDTFKNSSKSLRAVIKAMVLSPEFLSPKGAE